MSGAWLWMMMGSGEGNGVSSLSTPSRFTRSLEGLWSGDMESGWWEMMRRHRPALGNPLADVGFPSEGRTGLSSTGSSWPSGLRGSSSGFPKNEPLRTVYFL